MGAGLEGNGKVFEHRRLPWSGVPARSLYWRGAIGEGEMRKSYHIKIESRSQKSESRMKKFIIM
jgi:hypothetical protein